MADPFLTTASTVSQSPNWKQILQLEGLSASTTDVQRTTTDVEPSVQLGNVSLNSTTLKQVVYTSDSNYKFFLKTLTPPIVSNDATLNAAWTGDAATSGMLLLQDPGGPEPQSKGPKLRDVLQLFHIDIGPGAAEHKVASLLDKIDVSQVLSVHVARPRTADSLRPLTVIDSSYISGLWCTSSPTSYQVVQRLTFEFDSDVTQALATWIQFATAPSLSIDTTAFKIGNAKVTVTGTAIYPMTATGTLGTVTHHTTVSLNIRWSSFTLYVDISQDSISLTVIPDSDISLLTLVQNATNVLGLAFGHSSLDFSGGSDGSDDPIVSFLGSVKPWYLDVGLDTTGATSPVKWAAGLLIVKDLSGVPLAIGLQYDSASNAFFGELITRQYLFDPSNLRSPSYDARYTITRSVLDGSGHSNELTSVQDGVDLWNLLSFGGTPPTAVPHVLSNCQVMLIRQGDGSAANPKAFTFSFAATLDLAQGQHGKEDEQAVTSGFEWSSASINAVVNHSQASTPATTYSISIATQFALSPPGIPNPPAGATALASLTYDDTAGSEMWVLAASVDNLSVALLRSFFDSSVPDGALALLDPLTLRSLKIVYTYTKGVASTFFIYGILQLGDLELDLLFQSIGSSHDIGGTTAYSAVMDGDKGGDDQEDGVSSDDIPQNAPSKVLGDGGKEYLFEAKLRNNSSSTTLGDVIESIVPGSKAELPVFVSSIELKPSTNSDGTSSDLADLTFHSDGSGSALTVSVHIAGFGFDFVQLQTAASKKRLLRFTCGTFPAMPNVPLVGTLPQPFDNLQFLWVTDDQAVATLRGITNGDLHGLSILPTPLSPPVLYMETKAVETTQDIVLVAGFHFIVVASGKVALDHVFGPAAAMPQQQQKSIVPAQEPITTKSTALAVRQRTATSSSNGPDPNDPEEAKPTKGKALLKAGPLSITAIGFQVKTGHLLISLDATLVLGALTMSVIGFVIDIDLSGIHLDDLGSLTAEAAGSVLRQLSVSLHGLDVGVERGPLTLAGVFEHENDPTAEVYRGGIAVGFAAWQVLAIGEYKIVKQPTPFRAVFVYGKLNGPLIELEFATISGVRLAFAYNYAVRLPSAPDLYNFPLISDSGLDSAGNDPMAVLNAFTNGDKPFISAKEGSIFFAAGFSIVAFDVLTLTAVLVAEISAPASENAVGVPLPIPGVVLAILGDGILQMEPQVEPDASLFYIELVVKFEVNFSQGYIAADAALAPSSHVLVPDAHLTGSASFYSWFGLNSHTGDWVVSVGGYARNYTPPSHYPVPERIQLSFTVGDNIHIIGNGYIAVTPRCAMAGGTQHLSLSVGPVSAYADVVWDAYLNFKPFHFRASIGLSVGVECDIDILFIHIHVSMHIGADLILWGPHDFGGHAHVDFWFFAFGIDFGASEAASAKDPIDLLGNSGFIELIRTPGPASAARSQDTVESDNDSKDIALHKWSVETGLAPVKTPATAAGSTTFPSTGTNTSWDVNCATLVMRVDTDFAITTAQFAVPRTAQTDPKTTPTVPIDSVAGVFVKPMHSQTPATSILTITIAKEGVIQTGWRAFLVPKAAAPALWSSDKAWSKDDDPLSTNDGDTPPTAVRDGTLNASVNLMMGVRLIPPVPRWHMSTIIPVDIAVTNMRPIHTDKMIAVDFDDRVFSATMFEPAEALQKDQVNRWSDFGKVLRAQQSPANVDLTIVRAALAADISKALEWNIRPVGASIDDPDAEGLWILKASSPDRLANSLDVQWAELPFVSLTV